MADLPCPNCGSPLAFLDQYQRHYCLRCGQYAPEGYGDRGAKHCPTCAGILSYVSRYDRFYCYHCNLYAPEETTAAATAAKVDTPPSATPPGSGTTPAAEAPAPVVPTTTVSTPPTPSAAAEPQKALETPPETKPATPEPAASPAPESPPVALPAEPVPQEPSPEILKLAASKPGVVRVKIFTLKKSELIDLCKAYSLDPSGTKEQVQERLLSYLHDLEAEETPPEEPSEPTPPVIGLQPASTAMVEPAPTPEPEPAKAPAAVVAGPAASVAVLQMEKPEVEPTAEAAAPVIVEAPRPTPKVEHACPTCGRELTFIAQYNRYYCYFCQRYAPVARVKGACPTCGTTMRWIDQHQRWWCDSCQKYASADLPKPTNGMPAAPKASAAATAGAVARPAVVLHHHASPAAGMGLIGLGLALWIIYEVLGVLAPAMNLAINNPFTGALGEFVVFFAFIFVAGGALLGLSSLRDRL